MFLATTIMLDRRNPSFSRTITFTSMDQSEAGLIQLIFRYQRLINRINSSDIVFQLIGIVNLTGAVPASTITELGAVLLDAQKLTDMRSKAKIGDGYLIQLHPLDVLVNNDEPEPELEEKVADYVYTLPALTKYATITDLNVNLVVRDLFKIGVLFLSPDENGKLFWVMVEKPNEEFVNYTKGTIEANREAYVHYHAPTKRYRLTYEQPESVTKMQEELMKKEIVADIIKEVEHLGESWQIIRIKNSYYSRYITKHDAFSDTGPFSTAEEAEDFITNIKPATEE